MANGTMNWTPAWEKIGACDCSACVALTGIHQRCEQFAEPLWVSDCRMYGRGFKVANLNLLFVAEACEGPDFVDEYAAAEYVLARQKHCDVFVSSWPLKPAGQADYAWSRLEMETVPLNNGEKHGS